MCSTIIIVTGRAAAGKSMLATWLSQELKLALVSKDSIREELFNRLGWKDREWAQLLGKASVDLMFYFARAELAVGRSIIMDNAFNPVWSVSRFKDLKKEYNADSIQIVCNAGDDILFERFKIRFESGTRHLGHGDDAVLMDFRETLSHWNSPALDIDGAVINVDTTDFDKVDYQEILRQVKSYFRN